MPVYLVHGFRWPRAGSTGIRAFTILNNLEDCSSEYIHNEASKAAIRQVFRDNYPHVMQHLEDQSTGRSLEFVEQYDPQDESSANAASQPHAFVAIRVVTIATGHSSGDQEEPHVTTTPPVSTDSAVTASVPETFASELPTEKSPITSSHSNLCNPSALYLNVEDAMSSGPAVTTQVVDSLAELRDKVAEGEKIGWWIVYNGDPERAVIDSHASTDTGLETEVEVGSDVEGYSTATSEGASSEHSTKTELPGILRQPLPTLLPPDLKHLAVDQSDKDVDTSEHQSREEQTESTELTFYPEQADPLPRPEDVSVARPKSSKFPFPMRRKSSKLSMPEPKNDDVADPATLKEINKKEGRRYKFFGGRSEKKTA